MNKLHSLWSYVKLYRYEIIILLITSLCYFMGILFLNSFKDINSDITVFIKIIPYSLLVGFLSHIYRRESDDLLIKIGFIVGMMIVYTNNNSVLINYAIIIVTGSNMFIIAEIKERRILARESMYFYNTKNNDRIFIDFKKYDEVIKQQKNILQLERTITAQFYIFLTWLMMSKIILNVYFHNPNPDKIKIGYYIYCLIVLVLQLVIFENFKINRYFKQRLTLSEI